MPKDTFYFSHDYNARNDIKIKKLISKHGYIGYGIFWAIVEDLYNNANALPTDYDCIAFELRTSEDIIKSIVNDFELFIIKDGFFGSLSIESRLNERNKKSVKARQSANLRWEKIKSDANALPTQSECNAIKESKEKESKEKESKEKESKEKEISTNLSVDLKNQPERAKIDFNKLIKFFNDNRGSLPEVKKLTESRKKRIESIEKQYGKELIQVVIEKARDSDFIQGRKTNWIGSFDWIFKPENFIKIAEDNYINKKQTQKTDGEIFREAFNSDAAKNFRFSK